VTIADCAGGQDQQRVWPRRRRAAGRHRLPDLPQGGEQRHVPPAGHAAEQGQRPARRQRQQQHQLGMDRLQHIPPARRRDQGELQRSTASRSTPAAAGNQVPDPARTVPARTSTPSRPRRSTRSPARRRSGIQLHGFAERRYFVWSVPQDGNSAPSDLQCLRLGLPCAASGRGTATGTGAGTLAGPDANGSTPSRLTGVQVRHAEAEDGHRWHRLHVCVTSTLPADADQRSPATRCRIGSRLVIPERDQQDGRPDRHRAECAESGRRLHRAAARSSRTRRCTTPATRNSAPSPRTRSTAAMRQRRARPASVVPHLQPRQRRLDRGLDELRARDPTATPSARSRTTTTRPADRPRVSGRSSIRASWRAGEQCHLPNTYNYSTVSDSDVSSRLYRTTAYGIYAIAPATTAFRFSPYITKDFDYGASPSFSGAPGILTNGAATNLVHSPTAAVCFACHDSKDAEAHMEINGGSVNEPRSAALNTRETCLVCHGSASWPMSAGARRGSATPA